MVTSSTPQTRAAFAATASNTGCTSVGEALITCRISAVAVWRSSASFVSLNRRTFSIAITAWSAKVFNRSTWRCGVLPGSGQATTSAPTGTPSFSSGAPTMRRQFPTVAVAWSYSGSLSVSSMLTARAARITRPLIRCVVGRRRIAVRVMCSTASGDQSRVAIMWTSRPS